MMTMPKALDLRDAATRVKCRVVAAFTWAVRGNSYGYQVAGKDNRHGDQLGGGRETESALDVEAANPAPSEPIAVDRVGPSGGLRLTTLMAGRGATAAHNQIQLCHRG